MYGPPADSLLKWPKQRVPLEENLKLWRETIWGAFCGVTGIYPHPLGKKLPRKIPRELLVQLPSFSSLLMQYPPRFRDLLGPRLIGDKQVGEIFVLLQTGSLYARSDGSVKDGCGAHTYGFTSCKKKGTVWGGAEITSGSSEEMSPLRAEHGEGKRLESY